MSPHINLHVMSLLIATILQGMHCKWEYLYYEIVMPRNLVMFREQKEKTENVAHVLLIQGKWHIINLKQKKGLFVKNLDMPFIEDNAILKGWPGFSYAYQHSHRAKGNADLIWRCLSHQAYIHFKEFWAYDLQPILKIRLSFVQPVEMNRRSS